MHDSSPLSNISEAVRYAGDKLYAVTGEQLMNADDPMSCEHANEVPAVCPCPSDCYCQTRSCRSSPLGDTVITTIPPVDPATEFVTISRAELEEIRNNFKSDLEEVNQQIYLLQVRATALEAQLAKIEPMVEARASRTEKLVAELQVEMSRMTKALGAKDKAELSALAEIKGMVKTLLERDS